MEMTECPTCGRDDFASRKGMRYHHAVTHGESLRKESCENCGDEFLKHDDGGRFCSKDCYSESGRVTVECSYCGGTFTDQRNRASRNESGRRFCSQDCVSDWMSDNQIGPNHPNWRGGHPRYYGITWDEQRQKAIDRDGGECVRCGSTDDLHVHHETPIAVFDHPDDAHDLDNLTTLCRRCHGVIERQRFAETDGGGEAEWK